MARPLKILHLANHKSTNIGNGALIAGLERVLTEDFETPLEFTAEPWDDYTIPDASKRFGRSFVELCHGHDCLLVGAAVTMDGYERYPKTGMRFHLDLDLWDEIRCPIVFYGISHRTWRGAPYHHLEQLGRTIRFALEHHRVWFSVRNDGTREWLENQFGLPSDAIREVPDPATFVPTRPMEWPLLRPSGPNIAVSLNDEDVEQRFARADVSRVRRAFLERLPRKRRKRALAKLSGHEKRRRSFLESLAEVLDQLAKQHDANVILCPHHLEDHQMVADLGRRAPSRLKHQVLTANWLPRADQAPVFYDLYRRVDLVCAMRIHAMSPALGLGTPTIALSSQSRITSFMERTELSKLCLDIFSPSFARDLGSLAGEILESPDVYRERIRKAMTQLRDEARAANHEVERFILEKQKP